MHKRVFFKIIFLAIFATALCTEQRGMDWEAHSNNNNAGGEIYQFRRPGMAGDENDSEEETQDPEPTGNAGPEGADNTKPETPLTTTTEKTPSTTTEETTTTTTTTTERTTETATEPTVMPKPVERVAETPPPPPTTKPMDFRKFQQYIRMFSALMYRKILDKSDENENIFFSPLSIAQALGMLNAGARGNSSIQIKRSLQMSATTPNDEIHPMFKQLTGDKFDATEDADIIALMAARGYFNLGFATHAGYIETLMKYYSTLAVGIDFKQNVEAAAEINNWVEEKTKGLIKDLISPDVLTPLTRLVLVNALYFKAPWTDQFTDLPPQDFNTPTGVVKAPFLYAKMKVRTEEKGDFVFVAVPYKGQKSFFVIIMPKNDKAMEKFEKKEALQEFFKLLRKRVIRDWNMQKVKLFMPKFEVEKSLDVKKILMTMGVRDVFSSGSADLSEISNEFTYVTDFLHKAKITVHKDGTEAAAATAVVSSARMLESLDIIRINRPYIYAIFEEQGEILFMGKMVNPSGK